MYSADKETVIVLTSTPSAGIVSSVTVTTTFAVWPAAISPGTESQVVVTVK